MPWPSPAPRHAGSRREIRSSRVLGRPLRRDLDPDLDSFTDALTDDAEILEVLDARSHAVDIFGGDRRLEVYLQRPETCRELARGGAACQAELQTKRARSQRALLRVVNDS